MGPKMVAQGFIQSTLENLQGRRQQNLCEKPALYLNWFKTHIAKTKASPGTCQTSMALAMEIVGSKTGSFPTFCS